MVKVKALRERITDHLDELHLIYAQIAALGNDIQRTTEELNAKIEEIRKLVFEYLGDGS